ncbi:MAG: ATP-binding protein [Armatimonadota bacterium]
MIRKIIKIDEELCNGCGQCITACAEGALKLIDGKARLVSDTYCDGLGACLGECPMGALSFEEREAGEFDERAVHAHASGCPSARLMDLGAVPSAERHESALSHWPVKLELLPPTAPFLMGADLLLAADCSAFASGSFHADYLKGKVLAIACPKFGDVHAYIAKLAAMIREGGIKSLTVAHMEVPCCTGLLYAAKEAIRASGVEIPLQSVEILI